MSERGPGNSDLTVLMHIKSFLLIAGPQNQTFKVLYCLQGKSNKKINQVSFRSIYKLLIANVITNVLNFS